MAEESAEQASEEWSRRQLKINPVLAQRIERHVLLHKRMGSMQNSKQKWIEQALRGKLEREQNRLLAETGNEKSLVVMLDKELKEAITKRVNALKRLLSSYSFKKFVVDAIEEHLEEERDDIRVWAEGFSAD